MIANIHITLTVASSLLYKKIRYIHSCNTLVTLASEEEMSNFNLGWKVKAS